MSISNGYASLPGFKAYITVRGGSASTDTDDDTVIESLIEAVSRHIDSLTGRRFYRDTSDQTRYFQAEDGAKCSVTDLISITTLSVDYADSRTYTEFAAADFELAPDNASLESKPYNVIHIAPTSAQFFPVNRRGVKVIGKFGWPAIPADIENDSLAITHNLWMSRSGQASGGKITVTAQGVVIRPEDVPPLAMQNLLTYRVYL